MNNKNDEIKNWKLNEVIDHIEILSKKIIDLTSFLHSHNVPQSEVLTGINRSETIIDWLKMNNYYQIFFDFENSENVIKGYFKNSEIFKYLNVIILYDSNFLVKI